MTTTDDRMVFELRFVESYECDEILGRYTTLAALRDDLRSLLPAYAAHKDIQGERLPRSAVCLASAMNNHRVCLEVHEVCFDDFIMRLEDMARVSGSNWKVNG